nr:TPA_asm: hypothetical protein HUJ06_027303 [Nelumbo nucifera]
MANPLRTRKRVHAMRRAPDGSAFEKCNFCGVSVPVALSDMHECTLKKEYEKLKGACRNQNPVKLIIDNQPRSPFCVFMESFKRLHANEDWINIDRKGFESWKNMSTKDRHQFIVQAEEVNLAYEKTLLKEINDTSSGVDDEADSAMVGKYDLNYEQYNYWRNSDGFESTSDYSRESLDSFEL